MKKMLIATALLAGFTYAAAPKTDTAKLTVDTAKFTKPVDTVKVTAPKIDTVKLDSSLNAYKAKADSALANLKKALPDSLKAKVDTAAKAWKLADTTKNTGKVDSIKKYNSGKRDSLIAAIKDTAVASKIKARIADLEADKSALKAKLDARKATIDAKLEEIKKNKK